MLDVSHVSPKNFTANIGPGATVEFGDGVEEGDVILLATEEGATTPYGVIVTWGTTTGGGTDDAPAPAQGADNSTGGAGVPVVIGRDFGHHNVIRVSKSVKYVKVFNPDGSETVNNAHICLMRGARRL